MATISGVIVLAYPITMIVNNFNRLYEYRTLRVDTTGRQNKSAFSDIAENVDSNGSTPGTQRMIGIQDSNGSTLGTQRMIRIHSIAIV